MKVGPRRLVQRRKSRGLTWTVGLILAFVVGLIAGERGVPRLMVERLADLGQRIQAMRSAQSLPTLIVDVDFADYQAILSQRARALQSGVVLAHERDFVPADIRVDGRTLPVMIRLSQGLATSLEEGEKWGLEVRTVDETPILGARWFFLQDPASAGWLDQWAFVQALRREGILTTRYQFVRLIVNGDERGIYALRDGGTEDLLADQGRAGDTVVRFDSTVLLEAIARFGGDLRGAFADPVANLSSPDLRRFEVDVVGEAADSQDAVLAAQQAQAIGLLQALSRRERRASEIVDAGQYGRFLALADLWGAIEGVSPLNLAYHLNLNSGRLEPVVLASSPLAPQARIPLQVTYGDAHIQEAYVREVGRISQPAYLDQLQAALEEDWQRLAATLTPESGALDPPWTRLRERQEDLRGSLRPVRPVLAFLTLPSPGASPGADDVLQVSVGNLLALPVEIVGFDVNGTTFLPVDRAWIERGSTALLADPAGRVVLGAFDPQRLSPSSYVRIDIPISSIRSVDQEVDLDQEPEIHVATQILGTTTPLLTAVRPGAPLPVTLDDGE